MDQKVTINRSLVGWLALAFLTAFVISLITGPKDSTDPWQGICSRVGVVLGTLWLALPKDGTLGKWAEVSVLKLVVIVAMFIAVVRAPRKYLPILLAIAAAARFLHRPTRFVRRVTSPRPTTSRRPLMVTDHSRSEFFCRAVWVLGTLWWLLVSDSGRAAEPSLITINDLYRFDAPQGLVVAPSGTSAVYSRRWTEKASRSVKFSLWQVEGDAANRQAMENGEPNARSPTFSPDGKWIVFLSTRVLPDGKPAFEQVPPYSDPATDIWVMPAAGGKAVPLTGRSKPYGRVFSDPFYGHISFSPDGKRLVFVADDGVDPSTPEERANNVQIVREDQGEGYEGYRPAQIWIADLLDRPTDVAATQVTRVTNDDVWYGDPQWLPDGKSLIVHANRTADRESVRYSINHNFDLWQIELSGAGSSQMRQLTFDVGPDVSPRLSPDGKRLVCLSVPRQGSHADAFNVTVLDLTSGGTSSRVLFDHHGAKADQPPHLPPAFPLPRDCWLTNEKIFFTAPNRTGSKTQVLDLSQGSDALADSTPEIHNPDQAKLAATRRKLTPPSDPFLKDRAIAKR